MINQNIRNIAIIAHVDHGKTTLVDGFLKQSHTFRDNEAEMNQSLIMDSNDQERERGITILAKNTAVVYKGTKINIIDTPGHADFGGEVERTLGMAEGAILVIDAQEGPMPQTKFVLKKALELNLKIIVVINKIDKKDANIERTINNIYNLFLDLATNDDQLEFPIYYAVGREGKSWLHLPADFTAQADLSPIFDAIIKYIPAPKMDDNGDFQMQVSALDWDNFLGKYAVGKITRGIAKNGMEIALTNEQGVIAKGRIEKTFVSQGLKRVETLEAHSGDIVAITGIKDASIGNTITDVNNPEALPSIIIEEPTLNMSIGANTSPFSGRDGKCLTSRQILERINKELETNVALKLNINDKGEFILSGRGELHLSVFIETMRREGSELEIGKPHVIIKEIDGVRLEPFEELTIDVDDIFANTVIGEVTKRKGLLISQSDNRGITRLVFEISTRGILGLRNRLLTISRGTAIMSSIFIDFKPMGEDIPKSRNGVLVASESGKAVNYGLNIAQGRGQTFIHPQTEVYEGMIVGLNSKDGDLDMNVTKEKKLTNVRAASSDFIVVLTPPVIFSLEQSIDFLEDDELLEVTPKSLRLRKRILDTNLRAKARKI